MKWHPRLDRIEQELARRKRRQADAPAIILVVPDEEFHVIRNPEKIANLMTQSAADRRCAELVARGVTPPLQIHFTGQEMNC